MTSSDNFPQKASDECFGYRASFPDRTLLAETVRLGEAPWYMVWLGDILVADRTWGDNFDRNLTGFGRHETWTNIQRLIYDACKHLCIPKGELLFPTIQTFRHSLTTNLRQYKERSRLWERAYEVAETLRPDLVSHEDYESTTILGDLAEDYSDHVMATCIMSFHKVQFASVLMPTMGSKPALIIALNDDLPGIFQRYQATLAD